MRKIVTALALGATLSLSGCLAGPHQLRRSLDDFDRQLYVDNPIVDGVLWVVPVFPIGFFVAQVGDFFITDAYAFWIKDVWEGKGTGFEHIDVEAQKTMKSLLSDDGSFLQIEGDTATGS